MDTKIEKALEESKSISDLAKIFFGKENYTNREKSKKILYDNGVDWHDWIEKKHIKEKRYCLYCGKEIVNGDYRKKFCNRSCAASYNNIGKNRYLKNSEKNKRYCANCGKELNNRKLKFCSHECQTEYQYNDYINKWKDGKISGTACGEASQQIRKYLFIKYNNKCQCCGWGIENKYTKKIPLQIHHLDGDCTNNKEENLQLLCPNCHSLTDNFGNRRTHHSKRANRHK